jgi:hypothetical protein
MYDIVFAKPIPTLVTGDPSEALDAAEHISVTSTPFYLRDLKVGNDGVITYGNKSGKITQYGFEKFCTRILGIPKNFSKTIPRDLLFTNINRLQKDKSGEEVVVLSRDNDEIAAIVKSPYDECSYTDVIGSIMDSDNLNGIILTEELLIVRFNFSEIVVSDSSTKDTVNVANFLFSSLLKDTPLSLVSGLYRSKCYNSFIMPYLGRMKAHYFIKDHTQRLLRFSENISHYDEMIFESLKNNFSSVFSSRRLFDNEVVKYWKSLNRAVGSADADKLTKMSEETRKDLVTTVNQRNSTNKRARLLGNAVDENVWTSFKAYDFLNDITSFAQKVEFRERLQLEKIGGDIIKSMVLH